MEFPDFRSVYGSGCRPAQPLTVFACLRQSSTGSLAQNLSFELRTNCEQPSHSAPRWRCQIQSFGERNETNIKMLEFLQCCEQIGDRAAPAVQPPDQHDIDFAPASRLQ